MKGLTKTLVALVLVMTLVATMGMSAMAAASYSTKTVYQGLDKISVEAKATGLESGAIVTYVATTNASNINESTIVYLNQKEADANGNAQFTYTTDITKINASMFFGGSTEETKKPATATGVNAIEVKVDGVAAGTVYAAQQANASDVVIRKFDLSGKVNFSATAIESVTFNGTEITKFAVSDDTLIVSTSAINAAGTLAITTKGATFVKPQINNATAVTAGKLVAVAKAPVGGEFGIVIYTGNTAPEISSNEVVEVKDNYVVLPALGKNIEGIYAVEVEGIANVLAAPFNVKAYAYNGSDYQLSDAAVEIK